jgi:hypothetical protein
MTSIPLAEFNSINKQASRICYISTFEITPGYYRHDDKVYLITEVTEIDEPSGIQCYIGIWFKVI